MKFEFAYQFRAKLTGQYRPSCFEIEKRMVDGRWVNQREVVFWFDSELFDVYDSFSAPVAGGAGGRLEKEPYDRYGWAGLVRWFMLRNAWPLGSRFSVAVFFLWLTLFGGINFFIESTVLAARANSDVATQAESMKTDVQLPSGVAVMTGGNVQPVYLQHSPEPFFDYAANKDAELQSAATWSIGLLTAESIIFVNGQEFGLGEVIDFGPYEGLKLDEIDLARRAVRMGGVRVWLGTCDRQRVREWSRSLYRADHPRGVGGVPKPVQGRD